MGALPVDRHQLTPEQHVVLAAAELLAQLVRLDLVQVLVDALERAVLLRASPAAVLSPTPAMPGMLSVESPLSALKSIIWPGARP